MKIILSKDKDLGARCLRSIKTIHLTNDLNNGTRPVRQQLYCTGNHSGGMLCEPIDRELKVGLVKPAQSRWDCSILILSEKKAVLGFV